MIPASPIDLIDPFGLAGFGWSTPLNVARTFNREWIKELSRKGEELFAQTYVDVERGRYGSAAGSGVSLVFKALSFANPLTYLKAAVSATATTLAVNDIGSCKTNKQWADATNIGIDMVSLGNAAKSLQSILSDLRNQKTRIAQYAESFANDGNDWVALARGYQVAPAEHVGSYVKLIKEGYGFGDAGSLWKNSVDLSGNISDVSKAANPSKNKFPESRASNPQSTDGTK